MWPTMMEVGPLREWPGSLLPEDARRSTPFSAVLSSTLQLLEVELGAVRARGPVLLVAIGPDQFRLDGRPRASAQPAHPGVVLSFEHPQVGPLSYPCDTFTTWQANLRAVALALEALRKVDRYGVTTRGEQYRGFLALPARPADDDLAWLRAYTGMQPHDPTEVGAMLRRAKRRAHPDAGGTAADFQRVTALERRLREEGRL